MLCIIMRRTYNLVLLLNALFVISRAKTQNLGICSSEGELLQCCLNYKRKGESCEECWPGTYGTECKDDCPDGFYGYLCGEVCNCSSCDKVFGCETGVTSPFSLRTKFFGAETTNQDGSYTEIVIIASSLAGSLTLIILSVVYCKLRNRTSRIPTSLINKGDEQASGTPLNECPNLSLSSSHAANDGAPESTIHSGNIEPLDPQMCCHQTDFGDNSINSNKNNHAMLSTSDNVYSHLNMDLDEYHRLGLTSNSIQETDKEIYSAQMLNSCCYDTASHCSSKIDKKGYSFSEKECGEELNEYSLKANTSETHGTREAENIAIGMTKKDKISSVTVKIEPRNIEELSRKLHSFKP